MPDSNDLNGKVGLDTTAFKTGVTQLTAQIKSIETGFKASAAVMGSWSTTSEGLVSRTTSLSEKLNLQKQALEILHTEFDKVNASEGAGSKAADSLAKQMYDMGQKISSTEKNLSRYDAQLKTVESQEKGNVSSLARFKTGLASMAEQSKKSTSGIASHFGNLKSTIAGFATAAIAGLSLNAIIDGAGKAEKTMAQMDAVLKSTDGVAGMTKQALIDLAAAQAKVTTYSAGTTKEAENMMLTFTNVSSKVFPQAIIAAEDMATAMKMDATDASKTLGKALNDPTAGLAKLTKQGVTFTAAQKDQIKSMQKAGDVAGAQKIIIAELTKEFGGSAIAAGKTIPGQIQIMQNSLKSAGTTAMSAIMPIVTNLLPSVVKGAQGLASAITANKANIQNAVSAISAVVKGVFDFVTTHGTLVKGAIIGIASAVVVWKAAIIASNVVSGISNALMVISTLRADGMVAAQATLKAATGSTTIAQMALNGAMLANPITLVIALIAALVATLVILFNKNKAFHDWVIGAFNAVRAAAISVGNWFKGDFVNFFINAGNSIKSFFTGIPTWFTGIWNSITTGATNGANGIKAGIAGAWSGITTFFSTSWTNITTGVATAFNNIKTGITTAFTNIKTAIMTPITTLIEWVKIQILMQLTFADSTFNKIKDAILSVWTPIQAGLTAAWNGIKMVAQGAWELIKNVVMAPVLLLIDLVTGNFGQMKADMDKIWLNIQTACSTMWNGIVTFFTGIWGAISGGFTAFGAIIVNGLVVTWNSITAMVTAVWIAITAFFTTTWININAGLTAFWNSIPVFFSNLWIGIKTGVLTAWTAIGTFFTTTWVNIGNGLNSAWNGFWTTINNLCITIKNGVINIWNSVIAWFTALPATLMTIGSNMFTSMQNGVNSTINNVVTAVKTGIGAAIDWIKNLPSEAVQWGGDIINGIVNGIKNAASAVGDAVKGVAQNIRNFLHFSTPDEGPLKDFDTYMPDMMASLRQGMLSNLGKIRSAAREVATAMSIPVQSVNFGVTQQAHSAQSAYTGNYSPTAPTTPSITYSPTYYSPTALSHAEIARQDRQNAQRLALIVRRP